MAIGKCYDALKRPKLAERYFRKALSVPARTLSAKSRAHATYNLANSLLDQARLDLLVRIKRAVHLRNYLDQHDARTVHFLDHDEKSVPVMLQKLNVQSCMVRSTL